MLRELGATARRRMPSTDWITHKYVEIMNALLAKVGIGPSETPGSLIVRLQHDLDLVRTHRRTLRHVNLPIDR
jgi:hypothetical protein